ncbi:hypothetical protein DHEL01_v211159 [Diaporthe helianthi]|uniref:Uncharacterized protein n=1 Tax=Diaporthe helianthi TaxID=158607 RepID=A0A2P5HJP3_DIAHE|nr:hypothetical protein DHEL01_v211159 [Diaporthe helianthi]
MYIDVNSGSATNDQVAHGTGQGKARLDDGGGAENDVSHTHPSDINQFTSTMPSPHNHNHNPNWAQDNGQPKWIPFGVLIPENVGSSQPDLGSFPRAAQPHRVTSAGMPPSSGVPGSSRGSLAQSPNNLQLDDTDDLFSEDSQVPSPDLGSPRASFPVVVPSHAASSNTGTPSNAGTPDEIEPSIDLFSLPKIGSTITDDPNLPAFLAHNGVLTINSASGPGNAGRSRALQATVAHVQSLVALRGAGYGGYIRDLDQYERYKKVYKESLKRPTAGQLSDMPQDPDGQQALVKELCEAIANLEGIESGLTRKTRGAGEQPGILDSVGVKCVKEKGPFGLEMLAWEFLRALRDAQTGNLELSSPKDVFKEFGTFMGRFEVLKASLNINKNLVKDALESDQDVNRIVANPEGERSKKNANHTLNKSKAEQLHLIQQAKNRSATAHETTGKRKGGASTDTPTEKRTKLSGAPVVDTTPAQPVLRLQRPQSALQLQHQLPRQPQLVPRPQAAQVLARVHHQPPQQHAKTGAHSQPVGIQPVQPQLQHGNPEQHGEHVDDSGYAGQQGTPPQQGTPRQQRTPEQLHTLQPSDNQPSDNQPRTQTPRALEQLPQHIETRPQSGGAQLEQLGNLAYLENAHQNIIQQVQQSSSPLRQGQQPAATPELAASPNAAVAPGTHDWPWSS